MKKLRIIIEDISDDDGSGYVATFPQLKNSFVCGDTLKELSNGLKLLFNNKETAEWIDKVLKGKKKNRQFKKGPGKVKMNAYHLKNHQKPVLL